MTARGDAQRVLIATLHYAPDLIGCAKYTAELAEELVARGHRVEVVSAPPFYPAWRRHPDYKIWDMRTETINGVTVRRAPIYIPRKPSGLRRVLHLGSFAVTGGLRALWLALAFRPTIILTIAPTLALAPSTLLAARLCRARSWLHVQDFEVDAAFELGLLRGWLARRLAEAGEGLLLRRQDLVSSISAAMLARLWRKDVARERTFEFRNWADPETIRMLGERPSRYRTILGIPDGAIVGLYSGNMAAKQGLEIFAPVASALEDSHPNVVLVLCGDGPLKARLQEMCAGRRNVRFLPLQPKEDLSDLLGTADIHLLPQRREAADLVLPSKLTGMLASGRPVICGADRGTALAEEVEGCGLVVPPDDAAAFAEAIIVLAKDKARRSKLGLQARKTAETRWSKSAILEALATRLAALDAGTVADTPGSAGPPGGETRLERSDERASPAT